jgi:cellulose synthase/poly-beta-1,6-N-acetylglucosamine synthase-like glycosyltransferase
MEAAAACLAVLALAYEAWRWVRWSPEQSVVIGRAGQDLPNNAEFSAAGVLVSFLVPAWNAATDVAPFVRSFLELGLPESELILCAGGSDGTWTEAQRWERHNILVLAQNPGQGKQRALQKCWEACRGQVIYLTDIDCRPTRDVVSRLLAPILAGEVAVTTGGQRPLEDDWAVPFVRCRAAADLLSEPDQPVPWLGLNGRNTAVTRQALAHVGGFSTPAPSGTDYTLAQELRRRGVDIRYLPRAQMPTRYAHDVLTYCRQQRRWFRNILILGRRYQVRVDLRSALMTLALTYGGLLCLVLGLLIKQPLLIEVVMLGLVHILITRVGYQKRLGDHLRVIPAVLFMVADALAVMEVGIDLVSGQQPW